MADEPVSRIPRDGLNTNNFHRISASNLSLLLALSPSADILARFGHSYRGKVGFVVALPIGTRTGVDVNPLDELFKWLPKMDFAVLEHHYAKHGRDYILIVEDCRGANPGQHEIVFTHCVEADCQTRVRDDVLVKSWSDEFTDYERWTDAKEPDGYVWGTNWSLADPGFRALTDSGRAVEWTRRLGKQMFETTLETDRFLLRLIFHSLQWRKTSERHETISQVIHRL